MATGMEMAPAAVSVRIRRLMASDRDAIRRMTLAAGVFTPEETATALELVDIDLTRPGQDDYTTYCAVQEGQASPVGYACFGRAPLTDATYDLYWIVVDPSAQKRSVGSRLLGFVEDLLRKRGARILLAESSGLPRYGPARAFYARHGYEETARVRDYYRPGDDRVTFAKRFSL